MKNVDGMPVKGDMDSGDSMLWAGLMTAVGYADAIAGIKKCQTPDGRLWRCTDRVNNQPTNSFSRDMSLGFILYFAKTKDHEMADKWIKYIKKEGGLFPSGESEDTRHIVTPSVWWLMSYAGMRVPRKWELTRFLYKPYRKIEAKMTPRGYQTHLQGVALLILALSSGKRDKKMGRALYDKEPDNAFFAWLAGLAGNAEAINNTYRTIHDLAPGTGRQWCWEREDNEKAWKDSMLWDFLFIEMLLELDIE